MEINGLANLHILLDLVKKDFGHEYSIEDGEQALIDMKSQILLLERYMLAYDKAIKSNQPEPLWHEVCANPTNYPLNGGRSDSTKAPA